MPVNNSTFIKRIMYLLHWELSLSRTDCRNCLNTAVTLRHFLSTRGKILNNLSRLMGF